MKTVIRSGLAVIALVAAGVAPLAHADSFALHINDRHVGIGVSIGAPAYMPPPVYVTPAPAYVVPVPRYAVPAPVVVGRSGYWGTDGYRRVWVESPWGYSRYAPRRCEEPVRYREHWDHRDWRHDGYRDWHHDDDRYRR